MKCTHQDNPLTVNSTGLYCTAHGSTFDLQGNVTKEPALHALKKYKTELNESSIVINTLS
jgi:cytochrome b6-f complex iron-sulfur subunit